MGRKNEYQREDNKSSRYVNAVRNKKTGSVVMTPSTADELKSEYNDDFQVVESKIKE